MDYLITVLIIVGIQIILGFSMYIVMSSGQLSIGQAGFFAIGAYVSAMCTMIWKWNIFLAILFGGSISAGCGLLIGIPVLRLRGIYLAIATLGFAETIRIFFLNFKYGKEFAIDAARNIYGWLGPDKVTGFRYITYNVDHQITNFQYLGIVYLIVFLLAIFFIILEKSRLGSSIFCTAEDELLSISIGLNIRKIKVTAFTLSGFMAGLGGGLYSHFMTHITAEDFGFHLSLMPILYVVIGGMNTFWGAIVGAAFFNLLPEWLRFLKDYRMFFYAIVLITIMIYRPQGIIDKNLISRIKSVFKYAKN